jgi:hypothetical protein
LFAGSASSQKAVRRTVGDAGSTLSCRVTATGFPGGQTEGSKMATEGHGCAGKKNHQQMSKAVIDEELTEIRAKMEELALQMQQDAKSRWVYEWPMKTKVKWPVRELLAKKTVKTVKGWLRHAESLRDDEEEMVQVCEPEAGRNLSDEDELRSLEDLIDCQEGRTKIPIARRAMR